jgi:hypothetical protein
VALIITAYQSLENYNSHLQYEIVPKPLSIVVCEKYDSLAIDSTFDYLHLGHLLPLTVDEGELIINIICERCYKTRKTKNFCRAIKHDVIMFLSFWTNPEQNM